MQISNYEKQEHQNFINDMKDPLWKKIKQLFLKHIFKFNRLYYMRFKSTFHSNIIIMLRAKEKVNNSQI